MSIIYPSVLAYESKISCSDALLFSSKSIQDLENITDLSPIYIKTKSVRGTISNKLTKAQLAKIDASLENANPQTVDYATLEKDDDVLVVKNTIKFLHFNGSPCACNVKDFNNKLQEKIENYIKTNGLKELSHRYASNIANARSLFRNRASAEQIKVIVKYDDIALSFNAFDFSLNDFIYTNESLEQLEAVIEEALLGKRFLLLDIETRLKLGKAQSVFPSEEMCLEKDKNDKSKILFSINSQAAIHSQKIGNGIRTIDNFYYLDNDNSENINPIAIEPYGCVTNYALVLRKDKNSFYSLLEKLVLKDNELTLEQMHFLIAVLIRGGVFGGKN